ncbi:hypothetical protein T11_3309 [Trichinella zimbabwensis]|uniref:Uncharacterized protein n=1 Tax=Trichinella zimbabwensis TaxID=268475 RepID=A0A0V1HPX2_9BILA|nr:hypothetical protein T11_3309 [Trichinella zimbabwensis]
MECIEWLSGDRADIKKMYQLCIHKEGRDMELKQFNLSSTCDQNVLNCSPFSRRSTPYVGVHVHLYHLSAQRRFSRTYTSTTLCSVVNICRQLGCFPLIDRL